MVRLILLALAAFVAAGPTQGSAQRTTTTGIEVQIEGERPAQLRLEHPGGPTAFAAAGSSGRMTVYRAAVRWPLTTHYFSDQVRLVVRFPSSPYNYTIPLRLNAFAASPMRISLHAPNGSECYLASMKAIDIAENTEDALSQVLLGEHMLRRAGCSGLSQRRVHYWRFWNANWLARDDDRYQITPDLVEAIRQGAQGVDLAKIDSAWEINRITTRRMRSEVARQLCQRRWGPCLGH